ncbi:hypothetical protein NPIL_389971 [Nephila pilipes]|uniref:Uncharacterized protein n=1 Tax=Nephila pilipes TaxID=299642 RepID=A0A8X6UJJ5_NEPPI|nr:hypothetical protein NPIL_389971 [Nephila pilipes]
MRILQREKESFSRRNFGNSHLTLEEIITFTTQIEDILNSRSLSSKSCDINDLEILNTGYFILGSLLTNSLYPDLINKRDNYLWDGDGLDIGLLLSSN